MIFNEVIDVANHVLELNSNLRLTSQLAYRDMSNKARVKGTTPSAEAGWKAFLGLVGTRLAAERKARGLTQQQVAEQLQVEPESISRMEGGVIVPTLQRLRQFAQLYGCSMESLVSKTSDQPSDIARWLEQELLALEDVDRIFVLEQARGLIDHIKSRQQRPNPKKPASSW